MEEIKLYVELIAGVLSAAISVAFDIYVGYRLAEIKLTGYRNRIFAFGLCILAILMAIQGRWETNAASVVELILFTWHYRKYGLVRVSGAFMVGLLIDFLYDLIIVFLQRIPNISELMLSLCTLGLSIFYYSLCILLIKHFRQWLLQRLEDQCRKIFWSLLAYSFCSLMVVNLINVFLDEAKPSVIGYSYLSIGQAAFSWIVYYVLRRAEDARFKAQLQQQKQKELEEYANYLEQSEDNLRAFRHDYRNLLNSLKVSAAEGNVQELLDKLERYSAENLDSQALLKYKDTNHIQVKTLKSLIITKLNAIYQAGIPYDFECRQTIASIPGNVDELDLVRVIGITFDNALEESQSLSERNGHPEIQAMLYQETTDSLEFEIRNKIVRGKRQHTNLATKGFTTKTGHQGLGLANLQDIEQKYSELDISYNVSDGWFDLYLTIDQEEDE
ncbi:histidine kinase [Lactobacillus nasalidis]|uniref:Histidine kinase n=1 Tax=Lactobacillus nasalidis TaxID=2797258 RepID=A0ABQ3W4Q7_9LACO|nr:GHKL domain-containing protein [Lactobacillus nasalidis]GHV97725.1 histidine kinase [Lactobacillus nasalidis]GHV99188.1 histidine kinase [Lactobacillus nasalidis]GHW01520.1 histidine kinase [Lactobacillus nasalidis]